MTIVGTVNSNRKVIGELKTLNDSANQSTKKFDEKEKGSMNKHYVIGYVHKVIRKMQYVDAFNHQSHFRSIQR